MGVYQKFLEKFYDPANPISENNQFKLYVKDEMERRLTLMPDLGMDGDKPDGGSKEMKIAVVTCAFDNSKIINWLRERGDAIKNEHWDKLDKINDHIRRNLKKDSQLLDKLQRPCSLFITFESEEAYNRALLYNECIDNPDMPQYARFRTFLGEEIEI